MYDSSPYNPSFGSEPGAYIHREDVENKILNKFCEEKTGPRSYMIMGARGSGKTVLMHHMANRFETFDDWVVVRMNPNVNMLDSCMRKLYGHKKASPIIKAAKINLNLFSLTLEMPTPQVADVEEAIAEILKELKKNEMRLLIVIDEATNTPSMKAFVSAYQNLIGQKLPAYMLMTGLYEKINSLREEDNLTFLYRMPRIYLEPLNIGEIEMNYKEVFDLKDSEAGRMAAITKGYSYAFQLLGDLTWENDGDYTAVLEEYRAQLYEVVYSKLWRETTPVDRDVLYCIASSEDGKVKTIREMLGRESNEFSPYSDRLKKKGVADGNRRGYLELALPFFKGYVLDHYNGYYRTRPVEDLPEGL
ncbi:MAG: ATP-binding protein [Firmicutes bacterium]|nr:ATP-binding protein [Bacillota bacterium]